MLEAGIFALGLAIGALIAILMVWDKRFDAGRRYGYAQGREWCEGQNALERIRSLM